MGVKLLCIDHRIGVIPQARHTLHLMHSTIQRTLRRRIAAGLVATCWLANNARNHRSVSPRILIVRAPRSNTPHNNTPHNIPDKPAAMCWLANTQGRQVEICWQGRILRDQRHPRSRACSRQARDPLSSTCNNDIHDRPTIPTWRAVGHIEHSNGYTNLFWLGLSLILDLFS